MEELNRSAEFALPQEPQTQVRRRRGRGRSPRLRAGLVVAAVVLAPATVLLAAGAPLTTPAAAQTDGPPSTDPPSCINTDSTIPGTPTSVPLCEDTTITLPIFPGMTEADQAQVVDVLAGAFGRVLPRR